MIITSNLNTIFIELSPDERKTYDFMNNVSAGLFQEHIQALFVNRKRQHEEELRLQLTKNMSREELEVELLRKKNV